MASFLLSRTSRRFLKPYSSFSLSVSHSLFSVSSSSSYTATLIPNPPLFPSDQSYGWTPSSDFNFRSFAHFSTTAKSQHNPSDDGKKSLVSWIDLYLPSQVRPYAHLARLDKPIGTWLLAWPCMWYALLGFFPFFFFLENDFHFVLELLFQFMTCFLCHFCLEIQCGFGRRDS